MQCGTGFRPQQLVALFRLGYVPKDLAAEPPSPVIVEGRRNSA
jgi:hypothetical protein